jgi:Tfp pilus assembly PilM family ATPase
MVTMLPGRRRRTVGLDVGSARVRALMVEARGPRVTIQAATAVPVTVSNGAPDFVSAMHKALAEIHVDGVPIVAAIGGPDVLIRQVSLPSLPRSRVLSALAVQYAEFGLLPPERGVLDAQIVRTASPNKTLEVLAVSTPKTDLEERVRLFQRAALEVAIVDAEPLALLNGALHLTSPDPGELLVLLNVDERRMTLCLLSARGPVVARYLDIGVEDFRDRIGAAGAAEAPGGAPADCRALLSRMAEEIRVSLAFYRSEYHRECVPRYAISGWLVLPQIPRWLAADLRLESPMEVIDPLHALDATAAPTVDARDAVGPEFLMAFGLALRDR